MKFPQSILGLGMLAIAVASAGLDDRRDDVQTVHLTLHGGPESYEMVFKADGTKHKTS